MEVAVELASDLEVSDDAEAALVLDGSFTAVLARTVALALVLALALGVEGPDVVLAPPRTRCRKKARLLGCCGNNRAGPVRLGFHAATFVAPKGDMTKSQQHKHK